MSAKWRKYMKEYKSLSSQGLHLEAEQALLKAVREVEQKPEHQLLLAESLHECGQLMTVIGSFEEAEEALLRALKIRETALGRVNKDVAATITSLGKVYAPFDTTEAEKQLRRAIEIYQELNDADVVFPIECISLILLVKGKRQERQELLEKLVSDMEPRKKKNATLLGKSLLMLAQFWDEDNEQEAERLLKRALPLLSTDVEFAQNAAEAALALGKIQYKQQRFAEAEKNFKDALEHTEAISKTSAHTAVEILTRLAKLYMVAHRKHSSAEQLLMRAAAICQANIPPIPTNNVIVEYDRLCEITDSYDALEDLRKNLLDGYKSIIDEARDRCETNERSSYASGEACNLSRLLRRKNRLEEAESYAKWAVQIDESNNNPKLVASLIELASVYTQAGKTDEAYFLSDRILQLKIDKNWYFPQLADALRLMMLLDRQNEVEQLEQLAQQFIDRLAMNHEWCTGLCQRLALVYLETGRHAEAKKLIERAMNEASRMDTKDSLLFAFMMESWAAQFRLAGSSELSSEFEQRAAKLRANHEATLNLPV